MSTNLNLEQMARQAFDDDKNAFGVFANDPLQISGEVTMPKGQATKANSIPVVLPSDQGNLPVSIASEISPNTFPEVKKTLSQTSQAEQLTTNSTPCKSVIVQANKNNLGTLYVGPAEVNSDSFALEAGNAVSVEISNLNLIYLYGTATDKAVGLYTAYSG